ncbi:MAG TPA: serine hydrolase [Rhodanobacteraceae bacterium]|nr:serine hydrolase [Rhodanobacteraceae bacterium]
MKRSSAFLLILPVLAAPLGCHAAAAKKDMYAEIDQYMDAAAKTWHFMGSILVVRDGQVVIAKGYGMANVERNVPNTPDTEFRIGSNTKQFTSMAIMMLQAEGKLDVHDPVCKYVPDCPKDWQPITIHDLLTHTSGIPNFTDFPSYMKARDETLTPTQLLALFKDKPLDFKPGTKFKYSNSGYEVLGYIVEKVSGETYAQFLQQHIFKPLGMTNSGYDSSHPTAKNHARGYEAYDEARKKYPPASFVDMSVPFSAGALYSTVRDLYTWDRALAAARLLPMPLHQQMFARQVPVDESRKVFYGYGWFVSTRSGHPSYFHEGGIAGFTSINGWFPDQHAYVIVLDNVSSPEVGEVANGLTAILFGKPYTIPKVPKAVHLPASELEKFVGVYQLGPGFSLTVTRKGDQLITQATGQSKVPIFPESKTQFFTRAFPSSITFKTDAEGEVTGLVLHQGGTDHPAKKIQ